MAKKWRRLCTTEMVPWAVQLTQTVGIGQETLVTCLTHNSHKLTKKRRESSSGPCFGRQATIVDRFGDAVHPSKC